MTPTKAACPPDGPEAIPQSQAATLLTIPPSNAPGAVSPAPTQGQPLGDLGPLASGRGEFYLQSLLHRAWSEGVISSEQLARLGDQSLELLAATARRYCGHDSTSLPEEKVQSLRASNCLTIGLELKAQGNPAAALTILLQTPLGEIYRRGRRRLTTKLRVARHYALLAEQTLLPVTNDYYGASITQGLPAFFATYDADFAAQEILPTLDYQPYLPPEDLAGVEYVLAYGERLYLENLFGQHFTPAAIGEILGACLPDYPVQLLNIYEYLLASALGCVLAGEDSLTRGLTPAARRQVADTLTDLDEAGTHTLLARASAQLKERLSLRHPSLLRYLEQSLAPLAQRLHLAAAHQALSLILG